MDSYADRNKAKPHVQSGSKAGRRSVWGSGYLAPSVQSMFSVQDFSHQVFQDFGFFTVLHVSSKIPGLYPEPGPGPVLRRKGRFHVELALCKRAVGLEAIHKRLERSLLRVQGRRREKWMQQSRQWTSSECEDVDR